MISDGCIINYATIRQSILGLRSIVGRGSQLDRTVMMGSDYYETQESIARYRADGKPGIGIGENTSIENAIIDKNARVGDNCVVSPAGKPKEMDHPHFFIRDGIVIIPKNSMLPHGTVV